MNSAKLQSANKQLKTVYQQNQIKSICCHFGDHKSFGVKGRFLCYTA